MPIPQSRLETAHINGPGDLTALDALAAKEEKYQGRLNRTLEMMETRKRLQSDIARITGERLLSDEEKYRGKVQATVKALEQKERLQRDVAAARGERPLTEEEAHLGKVQATVKALEQKERLQRDVAAARGERELTDTEKYNSLLDKTIKSLEQKKRLKADMEAHVAREAESQVDREQASLDFYKGGRTGRDVLRESRYGKGFHASDKKYGAARHDEDDDEDHRSGRALLSSIFGRRASLALSQTSFGKALERPAGKALVVTETLNKVGEALSYGAKVGEIVTRTSTTNAQKTESLMKSIPLIGRFIEGAYHARDMAMGTADRMEQSQLEEQRWGAEFGVKSRFEREIAQHSFRHAEAQFRSSALANVGPLAQGPTARSTYAEQLAYQESQQRLGGQDRLQMAQAEGRAARMTVGYAENRVSELDRRHNQLTGRKQEADSNVNELERQERMHYRDKGAMELALKAQGKVNTELAEVQSQREQAINDRHQARVGLLQTESKIRKSILETATDELQISKQKEGRLGSESQALGRADPGTRQLAVSIGEMAKKEGFDKLLPAERQILEQFAPQYTRQEYERMGQLAPERKQLQNLGILEKGDLDAQRKQTDQLNLRVRELPRIDERQLAGELAGELSRLTNEWTSQLKNALKQAIDKVVNDQRRGNNSAN